MCPLLPSNRKIKPLQTVQFSKIAWLLGNHYLLLYVNDQIVLVTLRTIKL